MASFDTTETATVRTAGYQPALVMVTGTFASSAGATGGVIAPGYTNANGTFTASTETSSLGARTIFFGPIFTSTSSSPADIKVVKSYSSTLDRDIATITSAADQAGTYMVWCYDNGQ